MPLSVGMEVEGADRVQLALRGLSLKGQKQVDGVVSYGAPYAVYVHENTTARHPRGGQAKYLSGPARRYAGVMGKVVADSLRAKGGLRDGVYAALVYLFRKSQEVVPVDTGRLRRSARVSLDRVVEARG